MGPQRQDCTGSRDLTLSSGSRSSARPASSHHGDEMTLRRIYWLILVSMILLGIGTGNTLPWVSAFFAAFSLAVGKILKPAPSNHSAG